MAEAAEEELGNAMVRFRHFFPSLFSMILSLFSMIFFSQIFAMITAAKDWLTENFDKDNEVETKEAVRFLIFK